MRFNVGDIIVCTRNTPNYSVTQEYEIIGRSTSKNLYKIIGHTSYLNLQEGATEIQQIPPTWVDSEIEKNFEVR